MNCAKMGNHCCIGEDVIVGNNVTIGHNCIIEAHVRIGDNSFIDSNTIIRSYVTIGENSNIGSNCLIGEYGMDFYRDHQNHTHVLTIGKNALIRSGSIIYAGSDIGDDFQTGHQVNIRENTEIGDHVSVGTLSDIQGNCKIGNYVRLHSNVFVAPLSVIDNYVWLFPHVILTNDPTPPSEHMLGVHVHSFAIIAAGATIIPGLEICRDCLVGAGAVVTKSVPPYGVALGNPARIVSDVRNIRSKITGEPIYPWRNHFGKYMPWENLGFERWYASLNLEKQKHE